MTTPKISRAALTIRRASPRGFCAGVDRAIQIVERALTKFGAPVYVRHEIVHNRYVVERLRGMGAVFVKELDECPDDRPVVFSAHGVPKSVPQAARARELLFLDATCPLVSKVHLDAERHHAAGREIALIGHAGHPEVIGTLGQLPTGAITLIETVADVEGFDAAAKAAILAGLAFHTRVTDADVSREGITGITDTDVAVAKSLGLVIKLLAIAELTPDDAISVRVHPTLLPRTHPLASVREAFNAVFVEAEAAGSLMFYGRGAGGAPTASAVLGDVVAVARHVLSGGVGPSESTYADRDIASVGDIETRYLIRLEVADRPGVLAAIADTFAKNNLSIQTVRQTGHGDGAELIAMTHKAKDSALAATVKDLGKLDIVKDVSSVIRVEGFDV